MDAWGAEAFPTEAKDNTWVMSWARLSKFSYFCVFFIQFIISVHCDVPFNRIGETECYVKFLQNILSLYTTLNILIHKEPYVYMCVNIYTHAHINILCLYKYI